MTDATQPPLRQQSAIREMEARARANGHISKREYRDIREAQGNAARHIYQERTDGHRGEHDDEAAVAVGDRGVEDGAGHERRHEGE